MVRQRDINRSVGNLRLDGDIVSVGWTFTPSIGIVARDVDKLGLSIRNFREPLAMAVKTVMIPSIRQNFTFEGRPSWEPLAEYTVKVRGNTGPVLTRTGALRRAATSFNIWTITDSAATIKDLPKNVWYGLVHQTGIGGFGTHLDAARKQLGLKAKPAEILKQAFAILDAARGGARGHRAVHIPQRRFVMFQDDDLDAIQEVFADWLAAKARIEGKFM